jgi:hypothetical protein
LAGDYGTETLSGVPTLPRLCVFDFAQFEHQMMIAIEGIEFDERPHNSIDGAYDGHVSIPTPRARISGAIIDTSAFHAHPKRHATLPDLLFIFINSRKEVPVLVESLPNFPDVEHGP